MHCQTTKDRVYQTTPVEPPKVNTVSSAFHTPLDSIVVNRPLVIIDSWCNLPSLQREWRRDRRYSRPQLPNLQDTHGLMHMYQTAEHVCVEEEVRMSPQSSKIYM